MLFSRIGRRSLLVTVCSSLAGIIGCNGGSTPVGTTVTVGSAPSTVVDMHGILSQTTRPPECKTGPGGTMIPPLPSAWWQGVTPTVRQAGAVVGYETWSNTGSPAHCPNDFRTDIYRGFYTVDLSQFAGQSGAIIEATVKLTADAVPGITPATIAARNSNAPNSDMCDAQAGAAFQLVQIAGATVLHTGFTQDTLNTPALFNTPPIPNAYPSGPVVLNLPTKDPLKPASLGQPTFTADITQLVVSALSSGVNSLKFMLTGTNEPPSRKDSPLVPQTECKAIFSLTVDVRKA
jgi:hypothetical protein